MAEGLVKIFTDQDNSDSFIEGIMTVPENPKGIVIFAHGSGSGKTSSRNQVISKKLKENNIGSLLFDLLTQEEQDSDRRVEKIITKIPGASLNKFNITLLTKRLGIVTDWIKKNQHSKDMKISYFGSSTGAAAALNAATRYEICSIVIRSGRTDLVKEDILPKIISPCLFISGSAEKAVIKINNSTMKKLTNTKEKNLVIIQDTSHLLNEEGAVEKVAKIAVDWLDHNFS